MDSPAHRGQSAEETTLAGALERFLGGGAEDRRMVKLMAVKGIPILLLSGRMDAREVPAVRDAIASLIDRPTPMLIVDLSAVTLIDSAALAMLVATRKACLAGGGAMALCGLTPSVRITLELTRLLPFFPHYERLTEAVNALAPMEP